MSLLQICCVCRLICGITKCEGADALTHTYCPECLEDAMREAREFAERRRYDVIVADPECGGLSRGQELPPDVLGQVQLRGGGLAAEACELGVGQSDLEAGVAAAGGVARFSGAHAAKDTRKGSQVNT